MIRRALVMMQFAAAAAALAMGIGLTGCKEDVKANVDCKGQKEGINCEVSQTQGTAKIKVCWNIKATCKNGTVVTGPGCAEVSGGGKATTLVPNDKLENDEKCDEATGMTIENLVITQG